MKKLYKYIALVIGMVAFCACTDEIDFQGVDVGGNDVTLKLSVSPEVRKDIVNSRATNEENKLYDLHIYVFNSSGKLTGYEKWVDNNGAIESPGPVTVNVRTKTGESYIYAVANINNGGNYYLNDSKTNSSPGMKTDKELLNVTTGATIDESLNIVDYQENGKTLEQLIDDSQLTREKFKNIYYKRKFSVDENNLESPTPSTNTFVMSGYINDGRSVVIDRTGIKGATSVSNELNTIKLYRILAKNTITITSTRYTTGVNSNKYAFTPKYYRLCNVPKNGLLIPKDGIGTTTNNTNYNNNTYLFDESNQINIADDEIVEVETSYRANFQGSNSIVFYYPENLHVAKTGDGVKTSTWEWKDREKNSWNDAGTVKTFDHAADKASYIEIYGDYVDETGKITANVSYTIHLGNFSSSGNVKDFNVVRNYHYTYNIDVKGVKDIYVEATTETAEDNPYAEGIIINSNSGEHFDVDAHYEARVMEFDYTEIGNAGYILNISTPFGNTPNTLLVKRESTGTFICSAKDQNTKLASLDANGNLIAQEGVSIIPDIFNGEADFEWIKFVKNTNGNNGNSGNMIPNYTNISNYICKYPGDLKRKYGSVNGERKVINQHGWINVFELLDELYDSGIYTDNKVYYTCFIDENYYYNKQWPQYVDKEPRTVQIANNISFSSDKKSVYADVKYSISQRSICTFYQTDYMYPDPNDPKDEEGNGIHDLVIAFGTEIIDEEDVYNSRITEQEKNISYPDEDWDAWTSANETNKSKDWYSGNIKLVQNIQPLYTRAAKACMSRNRDLNGDGIITNGDANGNNIIEPEEREIRWYLAGIEQYRALFYGATPRGLKQEDAYLISKTELDAIASSLKYNNRNNEVRTPYHYYTCNGGYMQVFWPEEGLTNNSDNDGWSQAELVRCIRTLESGTDTNNNYGVKDPEPFYTFDETTRTFHLDGIVRTRDMDYGNPLLNHNEQTYPNNLYSSFVVAKFDLQDIDNEFNLSGNDNDNDNDNPYYFDLRAITGSHNSPNDENYTNDFSTNTKDYCVNYIRQSNVKGTDEAKYQWRTPNQKELALMASEMSDIAQYNYGTRTRFSGWDAKTIDKNNYLLSVPSDYPDVWGWNYAWVWHGDCRGIWSEGGKEDGARINVGLEGSDNGVRIRCVRDN